MKEKMRIFTEKGMEAFRQFLLELKNNPSMEIPDLNTSVYTSFFKPEIQIDKDIVFETRLEMAEYLINLFKTNQLNPRSFIKSKELWTWVVYFWFNMFCPQDNNKRKVLQLERYISSNDYKLYYRHWVAFPVDVFTVFDKDALTVFLDCPVTRHTEFVEKIASRQDYLSSRGIIKAAQMLYWDDKKKNGKTGFMSKNKKNNRYKAGNLLRFRSVLGQLELTYDIFNMKEDMIIKLLPHEFSSWKS